MADMSEQPVAKLAAKVAHELNNPLDAVLRFVSLAQRKAQMGEIADLQRHLADAQFGLQRMTEILRDLMDIGREVHHATTSRQYPLPQLLALSVRTVAAQAEQKRIAIDIRNDLPQDPPAYDLRLSQVISNLLKNAIEATYEGSVIRVCIAPAAQQQIEVTILDEGAGIDEALLPQLFMPFVTTKGRADGHGLGLAISRELVTSMSGGLTLENAPEGGCVARLTLPWHT